MNKEQRSFSKTIKKRRKVARKQRARFLRTKKVETVISKLKTIYENKVPKNLEVSRTRVEEEPSEDTREEGS